jgi:hypothetical protein
VCFSFSMIAPKDSGIKYGISTIPCHLAELATTSVEKFQTENVPGVVLEFSPEARSESEISKNKVLSISCSSSHGLLNPFRSTRDDLVNDKRMLID